MTRLPPPDTCLSRHQERLPVVQIKHGLIVAHKLSAASPTPRLAFTGIYDIAYSVNNGRRQRILGEGAVEARAVITDNGSSLLHLAAERGSLELVKLLLMGQWLRREGTLPLNIDARDSVGRTALFKASYFGHTDVAEGLLESGACEFSGALSKRHEA